MTRMFIYVHLLEAQAVRFFEKVNAKLDAQSLWFVDLWGSSLDEFQRTIFSNAFRSLCRHRPCQTSFELYW